MLKIYVFAIILTEELEERLPRAHTESHTESAHGSTNFPFPIILSFSFFPIRLFN
jgi:hypothetical protein